MVISQLAISGQDTRDNIGAEDSTRNILLKRVNEKILIEENSTIITGVSIGNSWICGSPTNGIVGVNLNTENGLQQVVGSANRVTTQIRVINPNNTFREHFRDATFKGSPTTANWDTTNYKLAMSTSSNHSTVYNTVVTSKRIWFDGKICTKTIFNATEIKWNPNEKIGYFLSADDGKDGTWEEVTKGTEHTFTTQGNKLKFKVIFFGNGGIDTYLNNIEIEYLTT